MSGLTRLVRSGSVASGVGAAVASAAASICCIGPLAITLLGVNGAIMAAMVKPYRWLLLAGSLGLLAAAAWSVYGARLRRPGERCAVSAGRATQTVLWIAGLIWFAALVVQILVNKLWLKGGGVL